MSMDALTALEATLTMRPKPRYAMSVMLARISSMGMSMLACTACCQAAVSNWRKSSGGGPPALGAAMPKSCRAAKTAACLCPMVMSAATGGTRPPAAALACKAAAPQAATTTFTLHAPAPAHNPGPARPFVGPAHERPFARQHRICAPCSFPVIACLQVFQIQRPPQRSQRPDIARSTGSQKAKVWHASRPERCCDLGRSLASQSGNRRQHRVRTDPAAWPGCSGMQTTSPGRCAPAHVWQIRLDKRCK